MDEARLGIYRDSMDENPLLIKVRWLSYRIVHE